MFLENGKIERHTLRQGDVISDVHVLGAINLTGIQYSSDINHNLTGWSVPSKPSIGDVIVLSHSCEIARENGVKLTSIILAPFRDVNSATPKEKINELISNNILREDVSTSYLKYFYIEPNNKLEFKNGAVADFSKCFSVRKNSYDYLLERKVLQLTDQMASNLGLKFALYFHRAFPRPPVIAVGQSQPNL